MENYSRKGDASRLMAYVLFVAILLGSFGSLQAATLSTAATDDLVFMREEEKLARDVYLTLYDKWNMRIFKNISASEQHHMDALKVLLDRYGIADQVAGNGVGQFKNQDLQALYDDLVAQGLVSLIDAMNVGVTIEETDIEDLKTALAVGGLPADVKRVYGNLLNASYSHLDAFNYQLDKL
ncbi:MAG TPA: DUF2202 domain-containing protein [Deltaproteobacteria bacterium]|nr:DUF2202 domain-containing protein [Deltaproteobacteria bacterium]